MAEITATQPQIDFVARKRLLRIPRQLTSIGAILLGFVGWEIAGQLSNAVFFPPFSGVIVAWWDLASSGELGSAAVVSLRALGVGFGLAVLLGLTLGTAMGLSRTVTYLLDVYINTLMAAPLIALIPIIAILLGFDIWARAAVVFLFSFFVIIVNAEAGMKAHSPELIEMARSFELSKVSMFTQIILPAALPAIMSGLRLGIIRAVKGMVTAELFLSLTGLGALADYYGSQFNAEKLFAVLLSVIAVSMVAGGLMHWLDRRLSRWQRGIARE